LSEVNEIRGQFKVVEMRMVCNAQIARGSRRALLVQLPKYISGIRIFLRQDLQD